MKILWTDGSASPNPGPGGFAVIEEEKMGGGRPVVLGREAQSTNIRMEGQAMVAAIKYAGAEGCEIHSDSEFWINVLTKWAPEWEKNGWHKKPKHKDPRTRGMVYGKGTEIKNLDIVKELYELYKNFPVELAWVQGHVGTELNEMADEWANQARMGKEI